jgi:hypothetical protein
MEIRVVGPGVAKPRSSGAEQQDGQPRQRGDQRIQHLLRAVVQPVQVLDAQAQRHICRLLPEHLQTGLLQAALVFLGGEDGQVVRLYG